MEVSEKAISCEEAIKLYRYMRSCKLSDDLKGEFIKLYGHLFHRPITVDIPLTGCDCGGYEKFYVLVAPILPPKLERIVSMGHCDHTVEFQPVQKMGIYPIHIATGLGNANLVEAILDHGGDMYSTTLHHGLFPLDIAILNGKIEISEQFLRRQFKYPSDERIMKRACALIDSRLYFGDIKGAESCIQAGAVISPAHSKQLLCKAVERCQTTAVQWLLDSGIISVNERLRNDLTALHYAKTADVAKLLLNYGADPTLITANEGTPLKLHLHRQRLGVAECIASFDPALIDDVMDTPHHRLANRYTALQSCAYEGYLPGVQMLVSHGANHRLVTYDGNTPISLACYSDRRPCVEYLLSLGCDINHQDRDGDTAIIYATYNGNWPIVNMLLKHGADPRISNHYNISPIWNAVYRRSVETVKGLLSLNVDPSKPCRGQNIYEDRNFNMIYDEPVTALFVAIHHEDITIAKALVSTGCYLNKEKYASPSFHMYVQHWAPDNKKWFNHVSSNPHSLQWWCKRTVRSYLPIDPKDAIESLPLPTILKAYIEDVGVP